MRDNADRGLLCGTTISRKLIGEIGFDKQVNIPLLRVSCTCLDCKYLLELGIIKR